MLFICVALVQYITETFRDNISNIIWIYKKNYYTIIMVFHFMDLLLKYITLQCLTCMNSHSEAFWIFNNRNLNGFQSSLYLERFYGSKYKYLVMHFLKSGIIKLSFTQNGYINPCMPQIRKFPKVRLNINIHKYIILNLYIICTKYRCDCNETCNEHICLIIRVISMKCF